jgi:hypothetical protein
MRISTRRLSWAFVVSSTLAICTLALLLLPSAPARGQEKAGIHTAYATETQDLQQPKDVFGTETPKVYISYILGDVPHTAVLKAVWIAEKLAGVQENSKIAESKKAATYNNGQFSYSKPTKGWPTGTYRVELYIDDKLEKTVKFKVAK